MSADAREFVDANILVYAFDASAGLKRERARGLLERLWESGTGCLSIQVLQEFFVIATRQVAVPLTIDEAVERIRELSAWRIFTPTADDMLTAIDVHAKSQVGFWDAMVVVAARELGCAVLWTEDLNDGQLIRGVRVQNPFS
jgi:predicted nucleic acid-binding protein